MDFRILGPLEVVHEDQSVRLGRPKQRALLARLLLRPAEMVPATDLVDNLWDSAPPRTATATLQAHVSRLRRSFADAVPGGASLIVTRKPGYMVSVDGHNLDSLAFQALVAEARAALAEGCPHIAVERLTAGLGLWRGPPLSELSLAGSAQDDLSRLKELRLAAAEELIEARLALGHHRDVLSDIDALIAQHPLREQLWGLRMTALYRCGRQADALRTYQQLRRVLVEEAGVDPSPESKRLEQAILLHRPEVAWAGPPSDAGSAAVPGGRMASESAESPADAGLPLPLTRFIGRTAEMAVLRQRLSETRLLTLTGFGGCGKTRLALQLAVEVDPRPSDGVRMAELSATMEPALVSAVVASAVGVQEQPAVAVMDTLVSFLRSKDMLVILDNCEQVLASCAEVASALLRSCPGVRILATSRQPLGLPGEAAWPVPPLSLPPLRPGVSLETIAASEAVQLFVDRASLVRPAFELSAGNVSGVVAICYRLDGIALALELAASRVGTLTPDEIAARLDDRFHLLTGGSATLPARQQTLEAAVDWSHDLLSGPERALFRWLSVFAGGCTLEAAEEVCRGVGVEHTVFDLLAALVSKSLLVADVTGSTTRYRLLETIRDYATERLEEAGEGDDARGRHAAWCVDLAERAGPELTSERQNEWFDHLDADHDNMRAAMAWALRSQQGPLAVRIAGVLTLFWRVRGHFREGQDWLDRALAAGADASPRHRGTALWGAGFLRVMLGTTTEAIRYLHESLDIARSIGDTSAVARALLLLGNCHQFVDGHARALPLLEESVETAREARDAWCLAHALSLCGWSHLEHGETELARHLLDESIEVACRARDKQGQRIAFTLRGALAVSEGAFDLAETFLEQALAVSLELREGYAVSAATDSLAELAVARGEYARANELFRRAVELGRESGEPSAVVRSLSSLAFLALQVEDAAAEERVKEAQSAASTTSSRSAPVFRALGELALARGDLESAAREIEAARDLADKTGNRREAALALFDLATIARMARHHDQAVSFHCEALSLFSRMGHKPLVVRSLEAVAGLMVEERGWEPAARVLGAAEAFRVGSGFRRPPVECHEHERALSSARGELGEETFAASYSAGQALSLDEAVAVVIVELMLAHSPRPS